MIKSQVSGEAVTRVPYTWGDQHYCCGQTAGRATRPCVQSVWLVSMGATDGEEEKVSAGRILANLADSTTAHGIPHIHKAQGRRHLHSKSLLNSNIHALVKPPILTWYQSLRDRLLIYNSSLKFCVRFSSYQTLILILPNNLLRSEQKRKYSWELEMKQTFKLPPSLILSDTLLQWHSPSTFGHFKFKHKTIQLLLYFWHN